jgi:HK97 family phage major capsid protein/HK97 family phage prohead protease
MPQLSRLPDPGTRITRTGVQSVADPYTYIMASDAVDRAGDVIDMAGVDLAQFKRNPVALWNHDSASPIGTWQNVKAVGGQLVGDLVLAKQGTAAYIDRLRQLIEQRILRAVSVGFLPREYAQIAETGGLRFTETELLECSLVSVPMNPNALRIKGLAPSPHDARIFSGGLAPQLGPPTLPRAGGAAAITRALSPKPGAAPPGKGTTTMPTPISEKIVALQARSVAIDDELAAISATAENDNARDFTEDETAKVTALAEEKENVTRSISTNVQIERALAARALPVAHAANSNGLTVPARPELKEKPGQLIFKMAAAHLMAYHSRRSLDDVIGERYRDDERVKVGCDWLKRSATDVADSKTPGWAAELVHQGYTDFVADVLALSIYNALSSRGRVLQFGNNGTIIAPRRTNQGNMAGAWVGETGVIPVVQGSTTANTFERYKLAGISTYSKELDQISTPQIEQLIRDSISEDTSTLIDSNLISVANLRAGVRPAGLLYGVGGIPSSGTSQANVNTDLRALIDGLGRNVSNVVIIMSHSQALGLSFMITATGQYIFRNEMANGTLLGYPLIVSVNCPSGTVVAVNASDFATGFGTVMFDLSEEATLVMANADATAPTQSVKADGTLDVAEEVGPDLGISVLGGPAGVGTAGAQAISMFQTWNIALRMVMPITWGMLRQGAVTWLSGVAW